MAKKADKDTTAAAGAEPRSPEQRQADRVQERRLKAAKRRTRRLQERAKAKASPREAAPVSGAGEPSPVHAVKRGAPKERQGVVVSNKAEKTITVRIDVARQHRRYGKILRSSATLHAHDEAGEAGEGDMVRVVESRPLSKTKRWRLAEVLEKAR